MFDSICLGKVLKIGQEEIKKVLLRYPNRLYSATEITNLTSAKYNHTHKLLRQMEKYDLVKVIYQEGTKMFKIKKPKDKELERIMEEVREIQSSTSLRQDDAIRVLQLLERRRKNGKKIIRK